MGSAGKKKTKLFKLGYLKVARKEGKELLTPKQYAYVIDQCQVLREWADPIGMSGVQVTDMDTFYKINLKGNVLGKINLRVFFAVDEEAGTVVVLGAVKKENEDQVKRHIVLRMKERARHVKAGLVKVFVGAKKKRAGVSNE